MQYFGFDRPSFGIKTFGFGESSPKLQADFTTGTYKARGANKTFADLFTFTRAGKAWLVKDTGLQEYAADVPRLDNGLLIEQSATNVATWALEPDKWIPDAFTYQYITNIDGKNTAVKATGIVQITATFKTTATSNKMSLMYWTGAPDTETPDYRFLIRNDTSRTNLSINGLTSSPPMSYISKGGIVWKSFNTWDTGFNAGDSLAVYQGEPGGVLGKVLVWYARQITDDAIMSSLIKTEATPVTRPADFLLNKITGTTVSGDWDSTLNLSISNGQLVHSGYGRIRSLEIN